MPADICPWGGDAYDRITPSGASRYMFSVLGDDARMPYLRLEEGLMEAGGTFDIDTPRTDLVLSAFAPLSSDNPLLFYVTGISVRRHGDRTEVTPSTCFSRRVTMDLRDEIMERRDIIVSETDGMGAYESELHVHDRLACDVRYSRSRFRDFNMVGPLLDGLGACGGIAKAASFLLNSSGVHTGMVTGVSDGEPHAWNMVYLDGCYHLDVTWDLMQSDGLPRHDFFNVSDQVMSRSRTWSPVYLSSGMAMNYHTVSGVVVYDESDMPNVLRRMVLRGCRRVEVRISSGLLEGYDPDVGVRAMQSAMSGAATRFQWAYNPDSGCQVFDVIR